MVLAVLDPVSVLKQTPPPFHKRDSVLFHVQRLKPHRVVNRKMSDLVRYQSVSLGLIQVLCFVHHSGDKNLTFEEMY